MNQLQIFDNIPNDDCYILILWVEMAQETRPQVYPLLPQEGVWKDSGKDPVSENPEVNTMQPVITVDNSRPTGNCYKHNILITNESDRYKLNNKL